MMLDRMEGNAELKTSVHQMLASRRLTHSVLLVGEEGLGAGFAARCIAADYLYPAGGAPAEALLRGECCRAVGKAGKRDSGQIETGIVREAISVEGMGAGGRYLVSQYGAAYTDGNTGEQVGVTNLLVLETSIYVISGDTAGRLSVKLTGSGEGTYFCGGKAVPITWSKAERNSPLVYHRADGTPLALGKGTSYVCIMSPRTSTLSYTE